MQHGAFGSHLGRVFDLSNPPKLVSRTPEGNRLAVTELRYNAYGRGFSKPIAPEEAYLVGLQLRGMEHHELWFNGRSPGPAPFRAGTTCFYDLTDNPIVYCADPFHSLQFYFPLRALSEAASEMGLPEVAGLQYPLGEFMDDPVIRHLGRCLIPSLHAERKANQTFVDHVLLAMRTHVVLTYGGARLTKKPPLYGLAPWQERRAKELMADHLSDGIGLAELAEACGLAISSFVRGFKRNTAVTPHQWLMTRRLELAVRLMADGPRRPLADIALEAGFGDQCHFTRVFTSKMGVSPGVWRGGRGR